MLDPIHSVADKNPITLGYLTRSLDNRAVERHLSVNTSTVEGTIQAIEGYLVIGSSDRLVCKAVGEDPATRQLIKLEEMWTNQSEALTAQPSMSADETDDSS